LQRRIFEGALDICLSKCAGFGTYVSNAIVPLDLLEVYRAEFLSFLRCTSSAGFCFMNFVCTLRRTSLL